MSLVKFVYTRRLGAGTSIEAAHCYRSRSLRRSLRPWASRVPEQGWLLWVDDVHGIPKWDIPDLESKLASKGMKPRGIYSERAFIAMGRRLLGLLAAQEKLSWSVDEKGPCVRLKKNGYDVVVARRDRLGIQPMCPLLACSWTAARLGLVPLPRHYILAGAPIVAVGQTETWLELSDEVAETHSALLLTSLFPHIQVEKQEIA